MSRNIFQICGSIFTTFFLGRTAMLAMGSFEKKQHFLGNCDRLGLSSTLLSSCYCVLGKDTLGDFPLLVCISLQIIKESKNFFNPSANPRHLRK